MEYYLLPVRRIQPDEIVEFIEMVINYAEPKWLLAMDLHSPDGKLTELVCEACLGNFSFAVSTEDRGMAAMIHLKWGRDDTDS